MIDSKEQLKKNEIRYNNYIEYEGEVFKIDNIDGSSLVLKDKRDCYVPEIEECNGIPLTEEWLLKFGYEYWGKRVINDYESYKRYVLFNFVGGTSNHEVHIIKSTYGNDEYTEWETSIDNDERQSNGRMDFVHDLQNAVKKETGKELELKEL